MPSARVEVGFAAALACTAGCTGPVAGDDSPTEAAPAFIPSPSDTYLVGIAWETGDMWCPSNRKSTQWANRRPTIAWVSTEGMPLRAIDWLAGHTVVARGRPADTPYSPFVLVDPEDECKSMAIDYRTPRGVRVDRGVHPPLDHFEIEQLQRVAGPRVELDADALTVRFENTLPVALHDLVIHVYYEPCHAHGYPGPRRRSSLSTTLAPGETAEHRFPRLFEDTANGAATSTKSSTIAPTTCRSSPVAPPADRPCTSTSTHRSNGSGSRSPAPQRGRSNLASTSSNSATARSVTAPGTEG
jgi:hypothetical protein